MGDVNIDVNNFDIKEKRKLEDSMEVDGSQRKTKKRTGGPKRKRPKTKSFSETKDNMRKIPVPSHRYTPLKENWVKIFTPIVEHLQLQVRFNLHSRNVEIKTCTETKDIGNLQKAADFVKVS